MDHNHGKTDCGLVRPSGAGIDRRWFLCSSVAAGTVAAAPAWLWAGADHSAQAAGMTTIKATHGTGLCNLGIFLVRERGLAKADGVQVEFVNTPSNADITTVFGAGLVDVSLIPYTNFMTLYDKGVPVKIVSGGGVEGCVICGQPHVKTQADAKGKVLGTFQADTLEILPYEWLKKANMSFKDCDVRYFGTSPELAQAFIAGSVDLMCHIEPYATQALNATKAKGTVMISNGTDVYHQGYTDCVLAARTGLINENRAALKALIKGLFIAQKQSEADRVSCVKDTVGKYYKASVEDILDASTKQPNVVDQRAETQFMMDRSGSMKELGYVDKPMDKNAFDWTLLQEVMSENKSLYDSLKLKS
jgi:NitT/TauT family transport system substrate-binding protein